MKFLLEFVACCGSASLETLQPPLDNTRLLATEEPRRPKHGRARGGHEWRPSLSSISEDVLTTAAKNQNARRPPAIGWQRCLKRKVASISQRDRHRSSSAHDDYRRAHISSAINTFSPAPFMF